MSPTSIGPLPYLNWLENPRASPSFPLLMLLFVAFNMSTAMKDGRDRARLEAYSAHWKKESSKETDADHEARNESYADVVNGMFHV